MFVSTRNLLCGHTQTIGSQLRNTYLLTVVLYDLPYALTAQAATVAVNKYRIGLVTL